MTVRNIHTVNGHRFWWCTLRPLPLKCWCGFADVVKRNEQDDAAKPLFDCQLKSLGRRLQYRAKSVVLKEVSGNHPYVNHVGYQGMTWTAILI